MLSITILAVDTLKKPYWRQAAEVYLKRLRREVKVRIIEVKAEAFGDRTRLRAVQKEGERLLNQLNKFPPSVFKAALSERGQEFSSLKLAELMEKQFQPIVFVVGGSLGLNDQVLKECRLQLALSRLTFPHELARVILLEQLYRAVTIMRGHKYHN
ncbi:23S rRNA (pseudouridine(1915)-N(3))-methyltransferase RlmH [Candidatus Parcubacteria bacterium]|nr:MAG: 23S rRNA (pseudouridine(1915)-N(3))-methyltransferase RlmH [Candidatus Parcubacteria bacterium]